MAKRLVIGLPPTYNGPDPYLRAMAEWATQVKSQLEQYSGDRDIATKYPYVLGSSTTTATIVWGTQTKTSTDKVLIQLIYDLQQKGILR